MSSSDLAKQGLVDFFRTHANIDSKTSDWKRTAKIKADRDCYVRRFENAKAGITALVHDEQLDEYEGEGDHLYCHEAGDLYVAIHEIDPDEQEDYGGRWSLMFVSKTQHEREGYFPDQHWGYVLEAAYQFPEGMLEDECMENTFIPSQRFHDMSKEELVAALEAVPGVTYNSALGMDD